jgi:hypothetical protein
LDAKDAVEIFGQAHCGRPARSDKLLFPMRKRGVFVLGRHFFRQKQTAEAVIQENAAGRVGHNRFRAIKVSTPPSANSKGDRSRRTGLSRTGTMVYGMGHQSHIAHLAHIVHSHDAGAVCDSQRHRGSRAENPFRRIPPQHLPDEGFA